MQIPLGPGQRVAPEAVQNRVITTDPGLLNRGGQAIAGAVSDAAANFLNEQRKEDDALARVRASNALLEHESQVKSVATDLDEQMRLGNLSYENAEQAYNAAVSKLAPIDTPGLDDAQREGVALSAKRLQTVGLDQVRGSAAKGRIQSAQNDLVSRMDLLGKDAAMPGANIDQINARMDAEDIDVAGRLAFGEDWVNKKQQFKDNNWSTQATGRMISAGNNLNSLQQLEHDLSAEDGLYAQKLDPEKRNQLLNSVTGKAFQVKEHNMRQAEMREMRAERVLSQMDRQAVTGIPPTPADQQRWKATLAGTSLAGEFDARVRQMTEVQVFGQLSDEQQDAYLTRVQGQMLAEGASVAQQETFNRLKKFSVDSRKLRSEDPVTYSAMQTGTPVEPIDFSGIGTPEGQQNFAAQIGERLLIAGSVRNKFGPGTSLSPWTAIEQENLKAMASSVDDATKIKIFAAISAVTETNAEYSAAIKPLAGDDLLMDTAGKAAHLGLRGPGGAHLSETLILGKKLLADKSKPMPQEKLFLEAFDRAVGFSMPAGTTERDVAYQSFRASYAAIADRKGKTIDPDKGALDDDLTTEAIDMATGGIVERVGVKVVKPYGFSDDDFNGSVNTQLDSIAKKTRLPPDLLKGMPLISIPGAPGSYYLLNGSDAQEDPATGQVIVVKLQ